MRGMLEGMNTKEGWIEKNKRWMKDGAREKHSYPISNLLAFETLCSKAL